MGFVIQKREPEGPAAGRWGRGVCSYGGWGGSWAEGDHGHRQRGSSAGGRRMLLFLRLQRADRTRMDRDRCITGRGKGTREGPSRMSQHSEAVNQATNG